MVVSPKPRKRRQGRGERPQPGLRRMRSSSSLAVARQDLVTVAPYEEDDHVGAEPAEPDPEYDPDTDVDILTAAGFVEDEDDSRSRNNEQWPDRRNRKEDNTNGSVFLRITTQIQDWLRGTIVAPLQRGIVRLYQGCVLVMADFVARVLSQPILQDLICDLIVRAINAFMDQDDIGTKMDDTARRVLYDRSKAQSAAHAIGKEVVPMVTGFVGGVASSLTPSTFKKKKKKQQQQQKQKQQQQQKQQQRQSTTTTTTTTNNHNHNHNRTNTNSTHLSSVTMSSDDETYPLESLEEEHKDKTLDGGKLGWLDTNKGYKMLCEEAIDEDDETIKQQPQHAAAATERKKSSSSFRSFTKKFQ